MKHILLLLSMLALAGCGAKAQVVKEKGVELADGALAASEWHMCRAASVGSVLRRYGASEARMAAWRELCQGPSAALPAIPQAR